MSAPAIAGVGRPTLRVRGTAYPVLLPSIRDPRLHLAAVIISLQVLGQVAFDFRLSISQILISIGTAGAIEFVITFSRARVIMWPASALLTGNGIAFILRVPGTEHGDWWSMHGWWIFAGTAAVGILSKYLIRFRGRHVFNPSNGALVLTFLLIGPEKADPLEFWWAPMTPWMVLALGIIVAGGFAILLRIKLLEIATTFWVVFAAAIGVLAIAGHEMTARWHLGPITGVDFWKVVVFSPEILIFLFFMITDPRTTPDDRQGRRAYAVTVALLAAMLIAPQTTEFGSKVAVLGALAIACALRVPMTLLQERGAGRRIPRGAARGAIALGATAGAVGLLVVAGLPARPTPSASAATGGDIGTLPAVTIAQSDDTTRIGQATAAQIAADLVADLDGGTAALHDGDTARASTVADGAWLAGLLRAIGAPTAVIPSYHVERLTLSLEPTTGQGPPLVVAEAAGTVKLSAGETGTTTAAAERSMPFTQAFELAAQNGRYVILRSRKASPTFLAAPAVIRPAPAGAGAATLASVGLTDVAQQVGIDFRQGSFAFGVTRDATQMMGGGVCWLDYDGDGWLDLYAVNSFAEVDRERWAKRGGVPRSALYRNDHGRFVDVSKRSGADIATQGNGCVAADLNGDGRTDLYVTSAGADALLWNDGNGRFSNGTEASGIEPYGWHAGATVGDVNGDGRPDLFVAGYTAESAVIPNSIKGFPSDHLGVADRLYVNEGGKRFREVSEPAGIERHGIEHGLGAVLTDANHDGRLDLFVANDEDPNRLYLNEPVENDPAGLGFRLRDVSRAANVDDANAGMGVAAADYSGDGIGDLFVTNSRDQLHAAERALPGDRAVFADARSAFAEAFVPDRTGWGASWVDLDLDGTPELALANGAIPVTNLRMDAQPVQVIARRRGTAASPTFVDVTAAVGLADGPVRNGRGLAAADFDNDGDPDIAVNTIGGRLVLLRTAGATGGWLTVSLGRLVPGTVVTATLPNGRRLVREVHVGSSYLSSEDPRVLLGLGKASSVRELVVRWPDGHVDRLRDVAANRIVNVG